ncbi:MAG: DUF6174 domain-containing protein [Anaerolineae bacterium]|jgi:hypothetical protein|nr:DUF6174 domain-containing protein [Anaerolineae bacterium]MDH7472414.1 DUF6174 domain-containing protein [Anaerolineae bacterium]
MKRRPSYGRRLGNFLIVFAGFVILLLLVTGRWRLVWNILFTPSYRVHVTVADVDAAQARWQARAVHDYRIMVAQGQPRLRGAVYEVTVRNGQITAGRRALLNPPWTPGQAKSFSAEQWEPLKPGPPLAEMETYTVPGLFDVARQIFERGPFEGRCNSEATIAFDPDRGFPTKIEYAWDTNCEKNSPELWAVVEFVPLR